MTDAALRYSLRDLENPFEIAALERVQHSAFGYADRDITPGSVMTVHSYMGGIVVAAYAQGDAVADAQIDAAAYPTGSSEPIGFAYGFPGQYNGAWVHHSHMLAIDPAHRQSGLASALKHHQRARAISLGYTRMTWTFDPLIARNGRFNLGKLRARAVSYREDWYALRGGIYAGLPADRFLIEWDLTQNHAEHPAPAPHGEIALEASGNRAGLPNLELRGDALLIEVPRDIEVLKVSDLTAARTWRDAHRIVFPAYLERGYAVSDLCVDGSRTFYLLTKV